MSDTTDDQDTSDVSADTVEFSTDPFSDSSDETTTDEAVTPAEPAEDKAETTDAEGETPAEETTETPTEGEAKTEETTEEQSGVDLKSMSRAERAEFFQQQQQQQRQQIEQSINEVYQPQPVDQLQEYYQGQGYDEGTSLMLARQDVNDQKAQIAEARAEVAELNMNLATEAMEVVSSIDWLNSTNKESYDAESTNAASELYEQLAIVKDPNTGQIIEAKISPRQFYQAIDKIRNSGTSTAQLAAQKAAEAQMAAVAPPTSTAPPSSSNNPDDKQASGLERALGNIR